MRDDCATPGDVERMLETPSGRTRLMKMVIALSREVERLSEDNRQLRAAVGIYRELLKKAQPRVARPSAREAATPTLHG
jgi:hypothetical protein